MKKTNRYLLIAFSVLAIIFVVYKQKQISSLKEEIRSSGAIMINGFCMKTRLNYNFNLVREKASEENIMALGRELSFTQSMFNSVITMNKDKINEEEWIGLEDSMRANKCVNYIFSLAGKAALDDADNKKLKEIEEAYNLFYKNLGNDISITGIRNFESLTDDYIEFLTKIESIAG